MEKRQKQNNNTEGAELRVILGHRLRVNETSVPGSARQSHAKKNGEKRPESGEKGSQEGPKSKRLRNPYAKHGDVTGNSGERKVLVNSGVLKNCRQRTGSQRKKGKMKRRPLQA